MCQAHRPCVICIQALKSKPHNGKGRPRTTSTSRLLAVYCIDTPSPPLRTSNHTDMLAMLNVSVRQQVWIDWPAGHEHLGQQACPQSPQHRHAAPASSSQPSLLTQPVSRRLVCLHTPQTCLCQCPKSTPGDPKRGGREPMPCLCMWRREKAGPAKGREEGRASPHPACCIQERCFTSAHPPIMVNCQGWGCKSYSWAAWLRVVSSRRGCQWTFHWCSGTQERGRLKEPCTVLRQAVQPAVVWAHHQGARPAAVHSNFLLLVLTVLPL